MNVVEQMKNIDICTVSKESLVDISTVNIDKTADIVSRVRSFVEQIKNPFCFICDDVIVKLSYCQNGVDFNSCTRTMFNSLE